MRFTSSRRSAVAVLLCAVLSFEWTATVAFAGERKEREPALLLKYAAPGIAESESRAVLDPLPGRLSGEILVRWVAVPAEPDSSPDAESLFPVPDDAALREIAGKIFRASRHMEKVENEEAGKLLAEAEREARGHRFTEATRPFFAEIFLRRGILKLREGDVSSAEILLSRSRALRPGFSPDPALFPPSVQAAWESARNRPPPEAELLVQSLPSGAVIRVDGEVRGKTPSRVRPGKLGPVRIRLSHKGYRDAEIVGQWLPGDAETLDFPLSGDRVARLGDLLASADGKRGKGSGPLFSDFAAAAGVERIVVLTLEKGGSGEGFLARAYARGPSGGEPAFLGERELLEGRAAGEEVGDWVAGRLLRNGWPPAEKEPEAKPWYKKWWFWGVLVSGVGIAALLAGGGGGSGGSGDSSVTVNF